MIVNYKMKSGKESCVFEFELELGFDEDCDIDGSLLLLISDCWDICGTRNCDGPKLRK